jgi:ATP-binding cassette subfamily B protein IrtA
MKQTQSPVKRLWELTGTHRRAYVLSIFLAILGVACGMIPYFSIAHIMLCLMNGVAVPSTYALWCGVILIGFTLKLLFSTLSTTVSHTATFYTLKEIRIKIADKLSKVPMGYIMDQPSGRFKDVIVDRVESMEPILAHLVPEMTSNLFVPLCMIIYLFVLDWRMALASLVTLPIGFLCYMGMSRGYNERFTGLMQRVQKMNAAIIEYIGGIEVIKAFNQSANSYQKYSDAVNDNASFAVDWMKDTQWFMSMSNTIWPSVWLAILPIGAIFYQHGTLTAPVFLTVIILSLGIVGPILGAIKFTDSISQLGAIVGEVSGLLDAPEMERPNHNADIHSLSIQFRDVSFFYDPKEPKPVLNHIDLTIQPNTMTAFVGPSGSGKSTITKLITGFWEATSGTITLGNVNLKEIPLSQLTSYVSYVSQDNYLFDESIRENIRMGRLSATDQEVEDVARKCGCHDFIMGLENGYDTIVGGAGGHLSGGERQRISIARAMLKDAPIIIFDEATAYLDPENESLVQDAISKLVKGKTLIMVAHRLYTVTRADQIVVVNQGQIEATGTHEELLEKCPLYNEMWQAHVGSRDKGGELE